MLGSRRGSGGLALSPGTGRSRGPERSGEETLPTQSGGTKTLGFVWSGGSLLPGPCLRKEESPSERALELNLRLKLGPFRPYYY